MFHVSYKEYIDSVEEDARDESESETKFITYEYLTDDDFHECNIRTYKKTYPASDFTYATQDAQDATPDAQRRALHAALTFYKKKNESKDKILIHTENESLRRSLLKVPLNKHFKLSNSTTRQVILLIKNMTCGDLVKHYPFERDIIIAADKRGAALFYNIITFLRQYGTVVVCEAACEATCVAVFSPRCTIRRDAKKLYALTQFITLSHGNAALHFYSKEILHMYESSS